MPYEDDDTQLMGESDQAAAAEKAAPVEPTKCPHCSDDETAGEFPNLFCVKCGVALDGGCDGHGDDDKMRPQPKVVFLSLDELATRGWCGTHGGTKLPLERSAAERQNAANVVAAINEKLAEHNVRLLAE